MDSQFRCGKCCKPVSSKYNKCLSCGYLGPHTFGSETSAGPGATLPEYANGRSERYTRGEPAGHLPHSERHENLPATEPEAIAGERSRHEHIIEDDSRFPAGMRSRSPILDHIEEIDQYDKKPAKKHGSKYSDRDSSSEFEDAGQYGSYEESEEKPENENSNRMVTIIVSVTLILVLAIAAVYIINNFDELTKWLASPTISEFFKPSD